MDTYQDDRKALEALIFDEDLAHIEALVGEFNIFEAIGVYRQELRHSDFLGFLLDPNENHGLGDAFLKRFLMRLLRDAAEPPISAVDIDLMDLDQAEVRREWQSIDILVHDPDNRLLVLIENKVKGREHSRQLERYHNICARNFPDVQCIIPVFLTPQGTEPSDARYLVLTYDIIAEELEDLIQRQSSTLGPDVRTLITHYVTMLRRHIVSDSPIAELARKIYRRHQRALDIILEHRPDLQSEIFDYLVTLIKQADGITLDHCSKSYVRFWPRDWDAIPSLSTSVGWTRSGRILLFEFRNYADRLSLHLIIGPGPAEVREAIFVVAQTDTTLFRSQSNRLYDKVTTIFMMPFLKTSDYEEATLDDIAPKINRAWDRFVNGELHQLVEAVSYATLPDQNK